MRIDAFDSRAVDDVLGCISVGAREIWVLDEEVDMLLKERERDRREEMELRSFLEELNCNTRKWTWNDSGGL